MAVIHRTILLTALILVFSSTTFGLYFIVDYFMDHGIPKAFGQACDDYIHDDCSYINSHINTFNDFDYRGHVRCKLTLDAGSKPGATWKLKWLRFKVEATDCSDHKDYLEFYDMSLHYYYRLRKRDPFMGRFCGWQYPYPNLTDLLTQRYFTFLWRTDGIREDKGWRVMATRVWPDPYCPGNDYYRCKAENICMDGRLKCDGVAQCDDGSDESECQWWEVLIGGFLALGTAGVTAISLTCTFFYVLLFFGIRFLIKKLRPKPEDQVVRIEINNVDPEKKPLPGGKTAKVHAINEVNKKYANKDKNNDKSDKKNDQDDKQQGKPLGQQPPTATGVGGPKGPGNGKPVVIAAGSLSPLGGANDKKGAGLPGAIDNEGKTDKKDGTGEQKPGGNAAAGQKAGTAAPGAPNAGSKAGATALVGATAGQKAGTGEQKADTNAPGAPKDEINAKPGVAGTADSKTGAKDGANAPGGPNAKAGVSGTADSKTDAKDGTNAPGGPNAKAGVAGTADSKTDAKDGTNAPGGPDAKAGVAGAPNNKADAKDGQNAPGGPNAKVGVADTADNKTNAKTDAKDAKAGVNGTAAGAKGPTDPKDAANGKGDAKTNGQGDPKTETSALGGATAGTKEPDGSKPKSPKEAKTETKTTGKTTGANTTTKTSTGKSTKK